MKILTNAQYAKLKDKERIANQLQKNTYTNLGYEKSAELLIEIGKRMSHKEDSHKILEIGKKWMQDIMMSYGNI